MQPPPRKGNYAKFLKNLHSEQIAKLLAKNQSECELLEDIRSFIIKKSAIEKSYSEALLKISSAYLNKKSLNIPDIKLSGGEEKWNMWSVWRTVLEENEKLARARLAAVEVFQQQIADDAKVLRAHKLQSSRKCVDQLALVQKEVQLCVQDLDKTKKLYFDEEHSAHDVRDKARDIEEKLKKKKGSFFQSITSLQKNSARVTSKKEQLEEKSSGARNDYLLGLAAANAHQNRYFVVDLHLAMSTMESSVYDKVAEYLTLLGRTELLTCSAMQNSFTTIRDQAKQLTRDYNLQCIYLFYPVLKQHIQYEYEACDNDPIDHVTAEHESAAATLSKEARKWATRIARDNNCVRESVRKLQIYNALRESGQKNDPNDPNGPDLESKIEDLKQTIRKAETSKAKAEARIECLRAGGVNVDEWLKEAETLNVQEIQRSTSSLSDHPSSDSFYDSDFADTETAAIGGGGVSEKVEKEEVEMPVTDSYENPEVDAMLEQERQRIEQLTAGWDDPTRVDWGAEETADTEEIPQLQRTPSIALKCTALYSYTAQNPDELTIVENEQLEVVGEGDGDGWLRARNYRGEEGYVPHNYLDVEREQPASAHHLTNQISFSSVDYTVENEEQPQPPEPIQEVVQSPLKEEPAVFVEPPQPVQQQQQQQQQQQEVERKPSTVSYCIALYDYDGEEVEELTFDEGQVIKVISKCAHDVDDGWWRGELEGRVGNFPSLVVEECDEFGEPITNQWEETPPCSAPPVCTPPEVPEHLMVGVLEEDISPGDQVTTPESKMTPGGFEMELSSVQHEQYGSQFGGGSVPTIGIIEEEEGEESIASSAETKKPPEDFGLGVAQIVITAATPMTEEPDQPFPPSDEVVVNHTSPSIQEEDEEPPAAQPSLISEPIIEEPEEIVEDAVAESAAIIVSSSTGSDGETTGPSTAENSVSQALPTEDVGEQPKQVVGGRASIPDELEPHQLACLQNLKESNA